MSLDINPEVVKHAPGVIGAVASTVFLKEFPWIQRIILIIPGAAAAVTGGEWIGKITGMPVSLAGLFVGLFAMALAAKGYNTLAELSLGKAITAAFNRFLGNKE